MNQHIKTWVGAVVIIIIVITVGVFVWLSQKDVPIETNTVNVKTNSGTVTSSQTNKAGNAAATTQAPGDADINAIESDLNSINDADFGDSGLSDAEVGL